MYLQFHNGDILNLSQCLSFTMEKSVFFYEIKIKIHDKYNIILQYDIVVEEELAKQVYANLAYILKHNKRFTTQEEIETKNFEEEYRNV